MKKFAGYIWVKKKMMLKVENIHTYYILSHILFGVFLCVDHGESVFLLGRNGSGKTTTLKSIMGLIPVSSGSIKFEDQEITQRPANIIANLGIGYVPEDRRIFFNLTVRENLEIGAKKGDNVWTLDKVYALFPILKARGKQAGPTLSGGEQQMLTIARTLMGNPRLLLLDEPTEGLAPLIVKAVSDQLAALKEYATTMLVCESNVNLASRIGNRVYLIEKGKIGWDGTLNELQADSELKIRYMGV
jgi:branched-chain amino acid transport system ATP-binding protein